MALALRPALPLTAGHTQSPVRLGRIPATLHIPPRQAFLGADPSALVLGLAGLRVARGPFTIAAFGRYGFHPSIAYRDDGGRWRRFPALVSAVTGDRRCDVFTGIARADGKIRNQYNAEGHME